jgi:hypothetical protein
VSDAGWIMEAVNGCANDWSAMDLKGYYEFLSQCGFAGRIWAIDSDANGMWLVDLDNSTNEVI